MKIRLSTLCAILLAALPVIGLATGEVFAASTGTVAATVSAQSVSVSVTDGSAAYGTLNLSDSEDTTSGGLNDTQTATNDGNVAEDFNIRSTDASGGTTWTLAGTVGADQYTHKFCNSGSGSPDPCDTGPTWTAMTTSYQALANSVSTSGTSKFDLQIGTPSSVSDYVQKSITVTVQAVID